MKRSEIISRYYKTIAADMVDCYRHVLECDGRIQYSIYIWDDGELEHLEAVQGDNSWLQPRDYEPRELFYVWTVEAPFFDPWDFTDHGAPDDEGEKESERQEIIDYLVQEYDSNISDLLDTIIDDAEQEERYQEERYTF